MPFTDQKHCIFEYRYRDASNYKAYGELLLRGSFTDEQHHAIEQCCESGEFFVAEQLDVPSLCEHLWARGGAPNKDDHAWHEYIGLRQASLEELQSIECWGSLDELLQRFKSVSSWDVMLSPNCWL